MKKELVSFGIVIVIALGQLSMGAPGAAQDRPAEPGLVDLVNPDGTLRLDSGFSGMLSLEGYQVQLDPARGPMFAPTSDPQWNALGGVPDGALTSSVSTLAISGTDVYVGGWFHNAAGIAEADHIAKWDGSAWSALGGSGDGALNAGVDYLAVSGTDVYVGGPFTNAAGIAEADCLAKWDGSAWSALGSNGSGDGAFNDRVSALAISGTDVYVGGNFTDAGGIAEADYLAKWNGSTWSALGSNGSGDGAFSAYVFTLAISGTDVYVGGWFQNAAGIAEADYLAKWNGSAWSALGSNGSGDGALNSSVTALAVGGIGVYVGGGFTDAAGIAEADHIAKWNGSAWSALGSNGSGDGAFSEYVFTLAVSGTDVYVGGEFRNAGGIAEADYIAKWNGSAWSALSSNGSGDGAFNDRVSALAVSGTDVYVGGEFIDAAGIADADRIAKWDGSAWNPFGGGGNGALNGGVGALAVSGTDVYVGGGFTNAAGIAEADYLAKWNGSAWSALGSNSSGDGALNGGVHALAISGADVYVGGSFTNAAGIAQADYLAKWNGSAWSALGSNGSGNGAFNNYVNDLAVIGTDVYVGGEFTNAAGIAEADYLVKWNGSAWSALGSDGRGGGAFNNYVYALAVIGTDVYVGGSFTSAGGIGKADRIAKWDGSAWSALGSNGSGNGALNGGVGALAVSGTDVYAGGWFQNAGGIDEADLVAKWDGSAWSALGSNGSGDGAIIADGFTNVSALAVIGTDVYVGGSFTDAAGITEADNIARWSESAPGYASAPAVGSTITMGQIEVGTPVTATLTISETGNAPLNVTDLVLTGPNIAEFNVSPTSFSIANGGAMQTVNMVCTPTGNGLRTATLTVNHNAVGSPATYTINCTGKTMVYLPLVVLNTP